METIRFLFGTISIYFQWYYSLFDFREGFFQKLFALGNTKPWKIPRIIPADLFFLWFLLRIVPWHLSPLWTIINRDIFFRGHFFHPHPFQSHIQVHGKYHPKLYCRWEKSCTNYYLWNSLKNGICRIFPLNSRVDVPAIAMLVERLGRREANFLMLPPKSNARAKRTIFWEPPACPKV